MFKACAQRTDSLSKESFNDFVKGSIQHYIDSSVEEKACIDTLKSELAKLHNKDVLISRNVFEWAMKEVQQQSTNKQDVSPTRSMAIAEPKPKELPSLYDSNTLYHASLCSCAVTLSRNEVEAHRYIGGIMANHKLTQVSVCAANSTEKLDRYLIARNGNIIYAAFQSEATLSEWSKNYNTFEEGVYMKYFVYIQVY